MLPIYAWIPGVILAVLWFFNIGQDSEKKSHYLLTYFKLNFSVVVFLCHSPKQLTAIQYFLLQQTGFTLIRNMLHDVMEILSYTFIPNNFRHHLHTKDDRIRSTWTVEPRQFKDERAIKKLGYSIKEHI